MTENTGYVLKVRAKGVGHYGLGDYFSAYSSISFKTPAYSGNRICAPGSVRGFRKTATEAELTWDEPYAVCSLCPDAIGYEVSGEGITTINLSRPPCKVSGLDASREYRLSVRARASVNNVSAPSQVQVGAFPGTPGPLQIAAVSGTAATLRWSASSTQVPVFDYLVACNGTSVWAGRALEYTMKDLDVGTFYTVEVRARTAAATLSLPVTGSFTTSAAPSDWPRNLRVTANEKRTVSIAWDAPLDAAPIGYRVRVFLQAQNVTAPRHTMYNLFPGLPLNIEVCCRFAGGALSKWVNMEVVPAP